MRTRLLSALLLALPVLLTLWMILYGILPGWIGLAVLFIALVLSFRWNHIRWALFGLALWAFANVASLPWSWHQYHSRSNQMLAKIQHGQSLYTSEKMGIFGLNLLIATAAYPLYPEVSQETFFLTIPAPSCKREFHSSFALGSKRIRTALHKLKPGQSTIVAWPMSEYALGHPEARYALALNPCTLSLGSGSARIAVNIDYPPKAKAVISKYPRIEIEEGLFHALQDRHWLHPYNAIWIVPLPSP